MHIQCCEKGFAAIHFLIIKMMIIIVYLGSNPT